jgi:hypothetical protein
MLKFFQYCTVALMLAVTACQNSSSNSNNPVVPASGDWKVTYFFDKVDETSYYTNYTFTFDTNGSLMAKNGSQTWTGTWSTGFDDSKNKFLINFNGSVPSALEELEEDWLIISVDDSLMHFEHTSNSGTGDTDVLKFER